MRRYGNFGARNSIISVETGTGLSLILMYLAFLLQSFQIYSMPFVISLASLSGNDVHNPKKLRPQLERIIHH